MCNCTLKIPENALEIGKTFLRQNSIIPVRKVNRFLNFQNVLD